MKDLSVLDIAIRFIENPLLVPQKIKSSSKELNVVSLLNPAVFRFERKTWLLVRVAERPDQTRGSVTIANYDRLGEIEVHRFDALHANIDHSNGSVVHHLGNDYLTTLSHFRLLCSDDGIEFYEPENYNPIFGKGELEGYGIEDCRVVEINDVYYLTYTMVSAYGVGVGIMSTRDWKRFERKGMIFPPHNRDCALFEEKIRDKYFALHRPSSPELGGNYIWLAESPDTIHWGNHKCVAKTRQGTWDSERIGAGCSPIRTPEGWLAIYHGADAKHRYCLGALLLDIANPSRVIARSKDPFMEPTEPYELNGLVPHMIFSNGHLVIGDRVRLYYSASNEVICGAELSVQEILGSLSRNSE